MHCDVISMTFVYYSKLNFSIKEVTNPIVAFIEHRNVRFTYGEIFLPQTKITPI